MHEESGKFDNLVFLIEIKNVFPKCAFTFNNKSEKCKSR
jgi:hypothetical protein